ncbi:hypothetical protein [Peribacillus simplex]|uniref:hypothetical protein n=1 Tax=Peribacillus simplex TaxID=1478 RepID=UPI003D297C35
MRPDIQSIQKINISAEKLSLLVFRLLESTFTGATAGIKGVGGKKVVDDFLGYLNKDTEQVVKSKGMVAELLFQSLKQLPEALSVMVMRNWPLHMYWMLSFKQSISQMGHQLHTNLKNGPRSLVFSWNMHSLIVLEMI